MPIRPDRIDVPDARPGWVVADAWRVAGQREDVAHVERVSAEELRFERHQVAVARREVDEALEVEVVLDAEGDRQRAHADTRHGESLMLTRSTPASCSSRAASIVRSMRTERGGSISTLTTNCFASSRLARRVGGGGSAAEPLWRSAIGERGVPPTSVLARARGHAQRTRARRASATSSAWRMWRMCSGVVPQQPPMIRAPASRKRRNLLGEVGRAGAA